MATIGRPKAELVVTEIERTELVRLTNLARVNRSLAFRARLVLACAEQATDSAVARRHRTSNATVGRCRKRFIERRLEDIYDEPRVGASRTISDEEVEAVIVKTLETTLKGETHWEHADDGDEGRHQSHDGRQDLRTFGLTPHTSRSFKVSPDPQFVDKVRDVGRTVYESAEH